MAHNFTDHDHEPKEQEFRYTLFEELPPVSNTKASKDTLSINALDSFTNDTETCYIKPYKNRTHTANTYTTPFIYSQYTINLLWKITSY